MKPVSHHPIAAVLFLVMASALSACSGDDKAASAPPPVAATAQPETVIGERYAETEAVIQAIDTRTRSVTLRMADGSTRQLTAPADVDLAKVKKGDVVILGAYEKLSVKALPPGSAPLGVRREAGMAKAEPGQTPGRVAAEVTRVVSEVAAVDVVNNTVTLRGADGSLRTLDVKHPDNQRKLKTLKVGDLVEVSLIEAAAIQLKPKV